MERHFKRIRSNTPDAGIPHNAPIAKYGVFCVFEKTAPTSSDNAGILPAEDAVVMIGGQWLSSNSGPRN